MVKLCIGTVCAVSLMGVLLMGPLYVAVSSAEGFATPYERCANGVGCPAFE
ncbi:MAG: hypothetical protein AAF318_08290 [Pseudomonadota bacterium]